MIYQSSSQGRSAFYRSSFQLASSIVVAPVAILALASLRTRVHASLSISQDCWRAGRAVSAALPGQRHVNAVTQRAQRHWLLSPRRHQPLLLIRSRHTGQAPARRLISAATPGDPYSNTAQLRQLGVVLGIEDYKELQSLIRCLKAIKYKGTVFLLRCASDMKHATNTCRMLAPACSLQLGLTILPVAGGIRICWKSRHQLCYRV